jgi:DNA-binding NarL/FixJ family response regulator
VDSVETAADESPRTRVGPASGALISEVAARVAELARAIHDLERLVHAPEAVPAPPAGRPEPDAAADRGEDEGRDEAEFGLFIEASNLTRREAEVLRHLLDGHSNRRISRSLRISESTVKNHLHAIFVKLDTRDRTQVVAKAYRFMAEHSAPPSRSQLPPEDPRDE